MLAQLVRLARRSWFRLVECPTVGCEPNWLERQMLGEEIGLWCRNCFRPLD